jgi:hypothetical protein
MGDLFSSTRLTGAGLGGSIFGGWGAGAGYTLGAEWENYQKFLDEGGNFWDYAGYRVLGWDPDKSVWENLSPTNSLNVLGNLVDPFGDLGLGGLFGGDDKKKEKKIAGYTQKEWTEKLGMSDEEYQNYLTELTRSISTGAAESRNRFSEIAAMNRLPAATRLAAERGTQIQANEAIQEGSQRLTQLREDINRQAELTALQMFAAKESTDEAYSRQLEQQSQASINNMLNLLGQYVGEKYFSNNNVNIDSYNKDIINYNQKFYDYYGYNRPGGYSDYVFGQGF